MRISIRELKEKEASESIFLVKEKHMGVGKNGRPFMSTVLGDVSGQIDARIWDNVEQMAREFEVGDLVWVRGQVQLFQNRRQFVIHKLEKKDAAEFNMDDFIQKSKFNPEDLFAELIQIVKSLKNDHIKELILSSLMDPEIKPLVLKAPAAKTIHHAFLGGLLEHVLSICKIMNFFAGHYKFLNRDLLIFGAIFHDLGKIWELTWDNGVQYTNRGRLLGHMQLACELVDRKTSRILGFPDDLRDILKHIILSHHGKLEYGSPKRPKFLEAMLVAMVDDLDSKVDTISNIVSNERGSGDQWSRYSDLFERYFLLDDLNEKY